MGLVYFRRNENNKNGPWSYSIIEKGSGYIPTSMKCIIAGSRSINDYSILLKAISDSGWADEITEVVCGDAVGADSLGDRWAKEKNIPVKHFPANWKNIKAKGAIVRINGYGKYNAKAGIDRNEKMAEYADKLIAIIENGSKGTIHMIETMQKLDKDVYIWEV